MWFFSARSVGTRENPLHVLCHSISTLLHLPFSPTSCLWGRIGHRKTNLTEQPSVLVEVIKTLVSSSQAPNSCVNPRALWSQVDFFDGLYFIFWCREKIIQCNDNALKQGAAITKSPCHFLVIKMLLMQNNNVWIILFSLSPQKSKQRKRVTGYVQLDFPSMLSSTRVSGFFCSLCSTESALGPCQESLQSASSAFEWVIAVSGCFTKPQLLESYECLKKSEILAFMAMEEKRGTQFL